MALVDRGRSSVKIKPFRLDDVAFTDALGKKGVVSGYRGHLTVLSNSDRAN